MKTTLIAALVAASTVCGASAAQKNYLRFTARGGTAEIGMVDYYAGKTNPTPPLTLEWTDDPDAASWSLFEAGSTTLSLADGETAYLRQHDPDRKAVTRNGYTFGWSFTMSNVTASATVEAGGNCLSIVDATCESDTVATNALCYLFSNCAILATPPELPATQLAPYAYYHSFDGCAALRTAPELPAQKLGKYCYAYMFKGCEKLALAPKLAATTLAASCYARIFEDCKSLVTPPALPADRMAERCYNGMFYNCKNLAFAPQLKSTELSAACYASMFYGCTALTEPPELPATTVTNSCYSSMFANCSSLKTAPVLPATVLDTSCYESMFSGATSLVFAPHLPASTLVYRCYCSMFSGCSNLKRISVWFTKWQNDANQTYNWVNGVSRSGRFIKPSSLSATFGTDAIPPAWLTSPASTIQVPVTEGLSAVALIDGETIRPTISKTGLNNVFYLGLGGENVKLVFSPDEGYALSGGVEYNYSPFNDVVQFGRTESPLPTVVRLAPEVSCQSAALQFDGLAVEGGAMSLSFGVRTTAALDVPDWQPATVTGAAISPDGKTVTLTIPATAAQGFYRLTEK